MMTPAMTFQQEARPKRKGIIANSPLFWPPNPRFSVKCFCKFATKTHVNAFVLPLPMEHWICIKLEMANSYGLW
uniref:Uncharacterized protein n=1 Tax=Arundo donax TaxID=35708 RepID=A0A0A9GJ55_ARUDO